MLSVFYFISDVVFKEIYSENLSKTYKDWNQTVVASSLSKFIWNNLVSGQESENK
jgi:hypothetical protein